MPKDSVPAKRKAPAPLFDNSTRGFLSTRSTATTFTASNITTHRYATSTRTHSQIIAALPKPIFGAFDEAIYARSYDSDECDTMDVDGAASSGKVLQSGLPGIAIKVRKRYINSVCLSFLYHPLSLN